MHASRTRRSLTLRGLLLFASSACALELGIREGAAGVIVVANRTERVLDVELRCGADEREHFRLLPGQSYPVAANDPVTLRAGRPSSDAFELQPDSIYLIGDEEDGAGVTVTKIDLSASEEGPGAKGGTIASSDSGETPGVPSPAAEPPAVGTVKVTIAVDDELYTRVDPEPGLRERIAAASAIFEQSARIRFEIVGVERWESIDRVSDFEALMFDLERKVPVDPGGLVIGFSTQASRSKERMGATRLPFHSHILVRDRGARRLSEPVLLELLVHELGHYLGAAHSPERNSAMRPRLGETLAGRPAAQIGLDPLNTMIVYLVGEELRRRPIRGVWELSPDVKARLRPIYSELAQALPEDPVAAVCLRILDLTSAPRTSPAPLTPLAIHARRVVQAVTRAAEENIQRPDAHVARRFGRPQRLSGDALTEVLVREAAAAVRDVPRELRPHALSVGLAVSMDATTLLRRAPLTALLWRSIETDREHQFRVAVLGQPTMRDRYDLVQHFWVSAGLAALFGSRAAETAGIWKEQADGTFSRADYSADLAGIAFFELLAGDAGQVDRIAEEFRVTDYVPLCLETQGESAEVSSGRLKTHDALREGIVKEIRRLPGYVNRPAGRRDRENGDASSQ